MLLRSRGGAAGTNGMLGLGVDEAFGKGPENLPGLSIFIHEGPDRPGRLIGRHAAMADHHVELKLLGGSTEQLRDQMLNLVLLKVQL